MSRDGGIAFGIAVYLRSAYVSICQHTLAYVSRMERQEMVASQLAVLC